jgi:hypothetical protein
MSELYRHLATQGVTGFHYVSNSPYELLPVLQSFFKHHAFPTGFSLKASQRSVAIVCHLLLDVNDYLLISLNIMEVGT